jgi:hypothetical protein
MASMRCFSSIQFSAKAKTFSVPNLSYYVGLSGGASGVAFYRLDPSLLFQVVEVQTPSWRDLKVATTPEAVSSLQVAEQNLDTSTYYYWVSHQY